jgi:hypothetical protein
LGLCAKVECEVEVDEERLGGSRQRSSVRASWLHYPRLSSKMQERAINKETLGMLKMRLDRQEVGYCMEAVQKVLQ